MDVSDSSVFGLIIMDILSISLKINRSLIHLIAQNDTMQSLSGDIPVVFMSNAITGVPASIASSKFVRVTVMFYHLLFCFYMGKNLGIKKAVFLNGNTAFFFSTLEDSLRFRTVPAVQVFSSSEFPPASYTTVRKRRTSSSS